MHKTKNEIIGPTTFINDPLNTGFTILPLSPLKELKETLRADIVELHSQAQAETQENS